MPAHTFSDTQNEFQLDGNPTDDEDMAKALKNFGPLIASSDHRWTALVPGTLDADTYAPNVSVPYGDVIGGIVPGAIFDTALADKGIHFAVRPSRLAKFFKDASEAVDDWPVFDGPAKEALPKAWKFLAGVIASLPEDLRLITEDEVIYDDDPDDAGTGTWYDELTPKMFISGDGGMELIARREAAHTHDRHDGTRHGRTPSIDARLQLRR